MKKDRTQISIHTDPALARKLREIAKAERRSLSAQIAKMLAEAVAWRVATNKETSP
jgi:hypothetical protein